MQLAIKETNYINIHIIYCIARHHPTMPMMIQMILILHFYFFLNEGLNARDWVICHIWHE